MSLYELMSVDSLVYLEPWKFVVVVVSSVPRLGSLLPSSVLLASL